MDVKRSILILGSTDEQVKTDHNFTDLKPWICFFYTCQSLLLEVKGRLNDKGYYGIPLL